MSTISFRDFVQLLPRGDDLRKGVKKIPSGVQWVESSNVRFVEPDLQVQKPIEPGSTSAVVLCAPGAVGKTTLALELASRTHAFLWDLSKFQVGSKTFSGTIYELYDFFATGVQARLQKGEFLFILDALDEAHVRAGSQNFDAFISDLADSLREPRAKPCVVLLARSDTADWVRFLFESADVPLACYQIEYFDRVRAVSFIEKRLDERHRAQGGQLPHRQQSGPFSEALNMLFGAIYKLFDIPAATAWEDTRVRNFLGYAPVLEALTEYVDVGNYMTLIQELKADTGAARDPWQFLTDIVTRLSHREQEKQVGALQVHLEPSANEAKWSGWRELYMPAEQYGRVLGWALRVQVDQPGVILPPAVSRQYEEALKTFLPQHPFLSGRQFANVVFKEFLYAWGVAHAGGSLSDALRTTMRDRHDPFLPSELFSRFIVNAKEGTPTVDGQDLGILYESFLSRASNVELTVLQSGEDLQASVVLDEEEIADLDLLDTGSGIHFWRRLCNAGLQVKGTVRMGLQGQRFLLGPGVDLDCGQLVVSCEDLDVDASTDVNLNASAYASDSGQLNLRGPRNESKGKLVVSWPGLGHPWVTYRGAASRTQVRLTETVRGDTLRKCLLMFRRQRTRLERTFLSARWSQEQLNERSELVTLALQKGVLRRISIGSRNLLEFNTDYASLMTLLDAKPSLSGNAREFVAEYLGKDLAERLLGNS